MLISHSHTVMAWQDQIIPFIFPKQITEIEPTGRLDYSNQDRLTALKAVTNFGAPFEVFDSEGECHFLTQAVKT